MNDPYYAGDGEFLFENARRLLTTEKYLTRWEKEGRKRNAR